MLELLHISKYFGSQSSTRVLDDVSLKLNHGEFLSLLGPSGCGKTTLLRIIAGLESPSAGEILLDGRNITHLKPQQRPFNMVFQKYSLFPHLSVRQNIEFGPRIKKLPKVEINRIVDECLDLVDLREYAERLPETLSGGQAQRVAMARALANRPRVLLLDEPLSALDKNLRENLQFELRRLQRHLNITFIFVTHDQNEAFTVSDRVALMNHGNIVQVDSPQNIYQNPTHKFAVQFIGTANIFNEPHAFVRPEKIELLQFSDSLLENNSSLKGVVRYIFFKGSYSEYHIQMESGQTVVAHHFKSTPFKIGESVRLHISDENYIPIPPYPMESSR